MCGYQVHGHVRMNMCGQPEDNLRVTRLLGPGCHRVGYRTQGSPSCVPRAETACTHHQSQLFCLSSWDRTQVPMFILSQLSYTWILHTFINGITFQRIMDNFLKVVKWPKYQFTFYFIFLKYFYLFSIYSVSVCPYACRPEEGRRSH